MLALRVLMGAAMKKALVLSLALASISLLSLGGCAQPTDDAETQTGAVAADTNESKLAEVAAKAMLLQVKENGDEKLLGSPQKIAKVLSALQGTAEALHGTPRCGPPRIELVVANEDGEVLAKASVCGATKAFLQIGSIWYETPFAEATLREVLAQEPAIGDILATADGATMTISGRTQSLDAKRTKKGFDADAFPTPQPDRPVTRCPPLITYTFKKGDADVATVHVPCGFEDEETAPAQIIIGETAVGYANFNFAASIGAF